MTFKRRILDKQIGTLSKILIEFAKKATLFFRRQLINMVIMMNEKSLRLIDQTLVNSVVFFEPVQGSQVFFQLFLVFPHHRKIEANLVD